MTEFDYSAKVIAHSTSEMGNTLATLEVTFPRFILAEMNTHRAFSRNSASSRARSLTKTIEEVSLHPFVPDYWGKHQRGMSAYSEVSDEEAAVAEHLWLAAKDNAVNSARAIEAVGLHKQLVNRILEPFMWHTAIISSTEWYNFFKLRISPDAQPEIQRTAQAMKEAIQNSTPKLLRAGEWHLPYLSDDEIRELPVEIAKAVSAARCARVSYLTQSDDRDHEKDVQLYRRLIQSGHLSPLEHVATPDQYGTGNFIGWAQLRYYVEYYAD